MSLRIFSVTATLLLLAACSDDTKGTVDRTVSKDLKVGEPLVQHDGPKAGDAQGKTEGLAKTDGPKVDANSKVDHSGTQLDSAAKYDGVTNLTCGQISACSDACAAACGSNFICLIGCPGGCGAKGCPAAKTPWDALNGCITGKCITQCAAGHTAACDTCVSTSCATEITACNAQTC